MNERCLDFELLQRFARQGEQSALTDVARRHLDLVYGTALRKAADPDAAQEIAQNVFAALARKAWQFGPDDSVPAWLHKSALFEANTWLRQELRRRRREETAAELGTTMNTSGSEPAFAELVPLLDEALLPLREKDRTALLLRFYESQSLRDVGMAFGVSEDTARKRVDSALEHAATTASAAVAGAAVNAVLQAAPPALAGFKTVLAWLARLTKRQKAASCAALIVFWAWVCSWPARWKPAPDR